MRAKYSFNEVYSALLYIVYILRSVLRIFTQCKYKYFIGQWQSLIIEVQVLSVQPPL